LAKNVGLRNSSNRVEKTNDVVVSKRQKKNGMSWSKPSFFGLASLSNTFLNGEFQEWEKNWSVPFKPVPVMVKAA
jgi:hypothetical protein